MRYDYFFTFFTFAFVIKYIILLFLSRYLFRLSLYIIAIVILLVFLMAFLLVILVNDVKSGAISQIGIRAYGLYAILFQFIITIFVFFALVVLASLYSANVNYENSLHMHTVEHQVLYFEER